MILRYATLFGLTAAFVVGGVAVVQHVKITQAQGQTQAQAPQQSATPAPQPAEPAREGFVCPSCGASFEKSLKFCGECGQPMKVKA